MCLLLADAYIEVLRVIAEHLVMHLFLDSSSLYSRNSI